MLKLNIFLPHGKTSGTLGLFGVNINNFGGGGGGGGGEKVGRVGGISDSRASVMKEGDGCCDSW